MKGYSESGYRGRGYKMWRYIMRGYSQRRGYKKMKEKLAPIIVPDEK